ncbi:hypothetical protein TRIUR3_34954 [Triticum urartu]|uniref:Uncharacterized protein n=1 Tax=Triticum urartu TaxID=4572 RepID=M7ZB01_TRIUA|nr:hypothetical protein TRIUR3_34954 [Triticum urartu]
MQQRVTPKPLIVQNKRRDYGREIQVGTHKDDHGGGDLDGRCEAGAEEGHEYHLPRRNDLIFLEHPDREVLHTLRLGMYCNANHMAKIADNC